MEFFPKLDVVLITLNDRENLPIVIGDLELQSTKYLKSIIVVDGGSSYNLFEVIKSSKVKIISSEKGMLKQTRRGVQLCDGDLVMLAEADHRYTEDFVQSALDDYLSQNFDVLAFPIIYSRENNFLEKGHKTFMQIHYSKRGPSSIGSGTQIWNKSKLTELLQRMESGDTFAFDTERSEVALRIGTTIGIGNVPVHEDYPIDFKKFRSRMRNYGNGDYHFYTDNKKYWSFKRKIKSLTHISLRYFISYPSKAIALKLWPGSIPYLWLVGFSRYYYWCRAIVFRGELK